MATTEKIRVVPEETVEQSIASEVLSLKTRADKRMLGFFANPQRRGDRWGDIVDRSNKVDLKDFVNYRRNLAPENWRPAADKDQQQIIDGLIEEIDTLVGEESKARHIGHIQVFVGAYRDALYEIGKIDAERKLRLGHFLMVDSGGPTRGDKNCLLFACLASEYGNLALQETDRFKRGVFLKRARFFHQASLFEGHESTAVPATRSEVAVAGEWKRRLEKRGDELVNALGEYGKEASLPHLADLLRVFTNLGIDVYLKRPEGIGEEEFGQQAQAFDEAAEVMIGYFRRIQPRSTSRVFQRLQEKYTEIEWRYDLKIYFSEAAKVDEFIAESGKEEQANYAVLGAAALTRVGQLVFFRIPEGAKVDIGELRKLYQEAVERYLARLSLL